MNVLQLMEKRKSIREFKDTPVAEELLQAVKDYHSNQCRRLFPEIITELICLDETCKSALEGNAGYQGKIFGASDYLLLLSEPHIYAAENAGYICEDLILKLTDMELDSCWLTVHDEQAIREALGIETDKKIFSVIAVGYGKKERDLLRLNIKSESDVDVVTREGHVAPKTALADLVFYQTWDNKVPLDETVADEGLVDALYGASLTPTFLNRQPFRFILDGGQVILVQLRDEMTDQENQKLNCGAAMLHFASVLEMRRPFPIRWNLQAPSGTYQVPEDCHIVGWCQV